MDPKSISDGGPAFPIAEIIGVREGWHGLSLRDHFAGLAMQGFAGGAFANKGDWPNREILAANAYVLADAMLKRREITS